MRLITILLLVSATVTAQTKKKNAVLLFHDDFNTALDTANWVIEKPKADSEIVCTKNGKLLIDTYGGATVWYKKELKGNIRITYKRKVIIEGGKNDRLSDLNNFWMATDPLNKMFTRQGGFAEYDSLNMYYMGMGGNYNKTTRFRKYNTGDKKIITEYTDSLHLLQPNKEYFIEIVVKDGVITFAVDGETFVSWKDEATFTHGYFGIRSTRSRQEVDSLSIFQLQ
jgi:hypothetical protein